MQRIKRARASRSRHARAAPNQARAADPEGQEDEQRVQKELDAAMAPLNSEQARLNRARMILYVKQFGPIRSLFSAKVYPVLLFSLSLSLSLALSLGGGNRTSSVESSEYQVEGESKGGDDSWQRRRPWIAASHVARNMGT